MQKKTNLTDQFAGSRLRLRQMTVDLRQQEPGKRPRDTFQQVQKCEKGINRVGANRLHRIAEVLNVPISFSFGETPGALHHRMETQEARSLPNVLASKQFLSLANSFSAIRHLNVRQKVVDFVDTLAATERLAASADRP
jgi:transcriptional regulator with XRE-family HTH domain